MEMESLLQRETRYNETGNATLSWQMENNKEKIMINCRAQTTELQQSSQSRGEVKAQEQIREVEAQRASQSRQVQAREDNRSELDSRTTRGRWP
jgi:hypothetical protein